MEKDTFSAKFELEEYIEPKKEEIVTSTEVSVIEPDETSIIKDYEQSRKKINTILDTGNEAIKELAKIAKNSQDPEAYAVLSNLMKNVADITNNLSKQHKDYVEIKKLKGMEKSSNGNTVKTDTLGMFKLLQEDK